MRGIITSAIVLGFALTAVTPAHRAEANDFDHRIDRYINESLFDKDDDDREDAAEKLGRIGSPRAVPALAQALLNDPDDDVREESAEALGRIGDPRALPALRYAAATDEDKSVRKDAYKAIDRIDPPRTVVVARPPVRVIERPRVTVIERRPVVHVPARVYVHYSSSSRPGRHAYGHGRRRHGPSWYYPRSGGRVSYHGKHWSIGVRW